METLKFLFSQLVNQISFGLKKKKKIQLIIAHRQTDDYSIKMNMIDSPVRTPQLEKKIIKTN